PCSRTSIMPRPPGASATSPPACSFCLGPPTGITSWSGGSGRPSHSLYQSFARPQMNVMARDALTRPVILAVAGWIALSLASSRLGAEPLDRQVAEWVILMGGSVRLEGQEGRIRELTQLPAAHFHLELADLVGTNIDPPDLRRLVGLTHLKTLN